MRKSMKPALALAAAASMLSFNTSAQTAPAAPTASQLKYFQDRALVLVVMFPGDTLADKEQTFTAGDTVVDPDGSENAISFLALKTNVGIDENHFKISPPPGTQVQDFLSGTKMTVPGKDAGP